MEKIWSVSKSDDWNIHEHPKSGGYHEISWDITSEKPPKNHGWPRDDSRVLDSDNSRLSDDGKNPRAVFDHVRIKTKKRKEHTQSIWR